MDAAFSVGLSRRPVRLRRSGCAPAPAPLAPSPVLGGPPPLPGGPPGRPPAAAARMSRDLEWPSGSSSPPAAPAPGVPRAAPKAAPSASASASAPLPPSASGSWDSGMLPESQP